MTQPMLRIEGLDKTFTLHLQAGLTLPVLRGVTLTVHAGECVILSGPSGAGKSTLLRAIYGTYRTTTGRILVRHPHPTPSLPPLPPGEGRGERPAPRPEAPPVRPASSPSSTWTDLAAADPRTILAIRRDTLGYVSQFLRVVPRIPALQVVAEALTLRGAPQPEATARARAMLLALNIPERLHALPPATFSGGEQQRVNLARGFLGGHPVLLLDEPTASLDAGNRAVVVRLVQAARSRGAAILGIVHDAETRDAIADRLHPLHPLQDAA